MGAKPDRLLGVVLFGQYLPPCGHLNKIRYSSLDTGFFVSGFT